MFLVVPTALSFNAVNFIYTPFYGLVRSKVCITLMFVSDRVINRYFCLLKLNNIAVIWRRYLNMETH
jgi:hypothetical protein